MEDSSNIFKKDKSSNELKKLTIKEFEKFINPFFYDITEETIEFLQTPNQLKEIKKTNFKLNFLISNLKLKKKKSIKFINLIEQKPITEIIINKNNNIKNKKKLKIKNINSLFPYKKQEIDSLKKQIDIQIQINSKNKREILKVLEAKIPIISHKKIQLAYDYQIINNFKYSKSYINVESIGSTRPLILKSIIIEKLEYMNLFDKKEWNLNKLKDNFNLIIDESELMIKFEEILS